MTNPPGDDERFEHIPWEQVGPASDRIKLILYGVAGAILIAGLTATVVGGRGAPTDLVSTPTITTLASELATTPATVVAMATTTTSGEVTDSTGQPRTWSEADLLAFPAETLAAEAAAMAEWLASDFFTIDGGTQIIDDLEEVLPPGSALPTAPSGARSFVEWARAVSVLESTPGLYDVLVVVRRLAAAEGETYRRIAPIGVMIRLSWTDQGWLVTDLPMLTDAPLLVQAPAWPLEEVPADISAAASASSGGEVLGGVRVGENWRLVVAMIDPAGVSWPMVIWADEAGTRTSTPALPNQP